MENLLLFANLNIDKAIQLAASYNFINGQGILLSTVYNTDLSTIKYIPFSGWPPGFTFCVTPFALLITSNLQTATTVADCFFLALLFFGVYKLFSILFNKNSKEYFALFCLLNMFSFSPIYYYTSTDRYALTFFVFALYFFVQRISTSKSSYRNSFMVALFIFLAAFTRFAYLPLTLIIPATLVLIGKLKKDKLFLKNGMVSLLTAIILSVSLYTFQKLYYGNGTYLEQSLLAFHLENLFQFDPVLYKSFFFTDTFESKLPDASLIRITIKVVAYLITFLMFFIFSARLLRQLKSKSHDIYFYFDLVCFFIIATTIGMLAVLSIVSPASHFQGNLNWTYVEESRYYAPVIIIFQIYVIRLVLNYEFGNLKSISKWFTFASVLYSLCYFSFKHYKIFAKNEKAGTFLFDQKSLIDLSTNLRTMQNKTNPVLIASQDEMVKTYSIISGAIPINNYDSLFLPSTILPTGKTILLECSEVKSKLQEQFITKYKGALVFRIKDMDWYKIKIK